MIIGKRLSDFSESLFLDQGFVSGVVSGVAVGDGIVVGVGVALSVCISGSGNKKGALLGNNIAWIFGDSFVMY